jgi:hypothetical protein
MSKIEKELPFAFGKKNYQLMIAGIATIFLGLVIMSLDSEPHGFGFLGLTLGPLVIMSGFVIEFFAIFHQEKTKKLESKE